MEAWEASLIGWLDKAKDGLQRAAATDLATWLPDDLLVKFDRVSMAHSLEGRAPYLAPRLVETALGLPPGQKMNGAASKVALRRVASRWLPREILERPKQGFVLPMGRWLVQWFEAQRSVREYFLARPIPGLQMREVAQLTQEDLATGVRRERLLFALVLLVEWHHSFKSNLRELARKYRAAASASATPVGAHKEF